MADPARPVLVYVTHPVGAPDAAGVEAHMGQFARWLRYLVALPDQVSRRLAYQAPWAAYVHALGDDRDYRARGMRDTMAALERADGLIALGRLTPGALDEVAHAGVLGMPIANLCSLGALPPPITEPQWWQRGDHAHVIRELAALVGAVDRRRSAVTRPTA